MTRFHLVKAGEAAVVGLVDIGLEKIDESTGMSFPLNAITIGRAGLWAVGFLGSALVRETSKYAEHLETLFIAEEPLLIRTIAKAANVIADYAGVPSREAIELRLKSAGQTIVPPVPGGTVQFR